MAKTVSRRGRNFTEYHEDGRPQDEFTAEISVADKNYFDGAAWQPLDENWITDGADGFLLKADRMNHKMRVDGSGGRRWYPRREKDNEYITFGRPQYYTTRWNSLGFAGYDVSGKVVTLTTKQNMSIKLTSSWKGIKLDWILANTSAPRKYRFPVTLQGLTLENGKVYGADGVKVATLMPTIAFDANGAELSCLSEYANGYITFSVLTTGAVYPVTIDPDYSVTSAAGDTQLYNPSTGTPPLNTRNYGASATFAINYLDAKLLFRFDVSAIHPAATVSAAAVKLYKAGTNTARAATYTMYSIASGNGNWIEGSGTGAGYASAGEPCWIAKEADGSGGVTTAWAGSAGMSTSGTDYEETALASRAVNRADADGTEYAFYFNASGVARVEDWVQDSGTNYGLLMVSNNTNGGIYSSEAATEGYRPVITVTYSTGGSLLKVDMCAQMQNLSGGMRG